MHKKEYRKALIMFIDILGTKNRKDFDSLYKINTIFHDEIEKNKNNDQSHTVYKRNVYTFSDSSYIIYDFKEDIEESRKNISALFHVALYNTQTLIQKFLLNGFIVRGGVFYGDVYYEENRSLIFGEGINEAYKLESKEAIYPRIVIHDSVACEVIKYNKSLLDQCHNETIRQLTNMINGEIVLRDKKDGKYYLNYLVSIKQGHDYSKGNDILKRIEELIKEEKKHCESEIDRLKKFNLVEEIENYKKILRKYKWLECYVENSKPEQDSTVTSIHV